MNSSSNNCLSNTPAGAYPQPRSSRRLFAPVLPTAENPTTTHGRWLAARQGSHGFFAGESPQALPHGWERNAISPDYCLVSPRAGIALPSCGGGKSMQHLPCCLAEPPHPPPLECFVVDHTLNCIDVDGLLPPPLNPPSAAIQSASWRWICGFFVQGFSLCSCLFACCLY